MNLQINFIVTNVHDDVDKDTTKLNDFCEIKKARRRRSTKKKKKSKKRKSERK